MTGTRGASSVEQPGDRTGLALQRLQPLADVSDEHLGEERELGLVEVEARLPLVDRGEELRDLRREGAVRVEHGAHRVGEHRRSGRLDVQAEQRLQRCREHVESAERHVPDVVYLGEHALDELVHLLADTGD